LTSINVYVIFTADQLKLKRRCRMLIVFFEAGYTYFDMKIQNDNNKIEVSIEDDDGFIIEEIDNDILEEIREGEFDAEVVSNFSNWLKSELSYLRVDVDDLISTLKNEYEINTDGKAVIITIGYVI
jgi:hypothetical protein